VEAANTALPEYTAANACVPEVNVLVLSVAKPEELTVTVPSSVEPSKKLTVPRGDPVSAGETVAVKRIDCPEIAGFGLAIRTVAVETAEITSDTDEEVEAAKPALPEYTAVKECEPTVKLLVVNVASPDEFTFADAIKVEPSKKLTMPSGEPVGVGEMVAVNVTD